MRNINRRESPRVEINLRCHVSAPAQAPWLLHGAMYTENISRGGVLIAWMGEGEPLAAPAPGQSVTVEIELPASHGFGPKCIHCEGTVMRVSDSRGEYPRVALRVNYMDFRSFHDEIRAFEALHPAVGSWMA
jgi:hypothetical protein